MKLSPWLFESLFLIRAGTCTRNVVLWHSKYFRPQRRAHVVVVLEAPEHPRLPAAHQICRGAALDQSAIELRRGLLLRLLEVVFARGRQLVAVLQADEGLLAQLEHQRVMPAAVGLHVMFDSIVDFSDSVLFQHFSACIDFCGAGERAEVI